MTKINVCVVFGALIFVLTEARSCTQQWQCANPSDFNHVSCPVSGVCQCRLEQGFVGDVDAGCGCPSPNSIFWTPANIPYCINLPAVTGAAYREKVRKQVVTEIMNNLVNPNAVQWANGSIIPPQFAPNVRGRVDPLGKFDGVALIEYYYGNAARIGGYVSHVYQKELAYNDVTNVVFHRTDIEFSVFVPALNRYVIFGNVTQSGFFRFAPNNTVISVDVINHNVATVSNFQITLGQGGLIYAENRLPWYNQLCTRILAKCDANLDPLGYYTSVSDCVSFMQTVRKTDYNAPAGNTDVCRQLHMDLVDWDAAHHCPHTGKTGGGQCVDPAYYTAGYFLDSY